MQFLNKCIPFARRVLNHDASKRGLVAAAAGILAAAASEALWPTS